MKNWLGIALMCGILIASYPPQLSAEQIAPKQLSPEEIGNLTTFKDWCVNQERLPPEAKRTIEELLGQAETKDCDRASKKLASIMNLSLNQMLYWGQIADLRPLSGLTNLTHLYLGKNRIADLKPLSKLTNLTALSLDNNQIVDLKPLSGLTSLYWLDLSGNQIVDPRPLSGLTKLKHLDLPENPIKNKTCSVKPESICKF